MSRHSFDPDIAAKVGLNAAVIYQNILWWCEKNAANGHNLHDGIAWTYNSLHAFDQLFPYLTKKQIRLALDKLEETGLVRVANFNKDPRDRTKWYAPGAVPKGHLHLPERAKRCAQKGRPLPVSKPVINNTPKPPGGAYGGDDEANDQIDRNAQGGERERSDTLFANAELPSKPSLNASFNAFWAVYPKKAGKPAAQKAFAKALKSTPAANVINGAKKYAAWLESGAPGEFRPQAKHPQGWLNDRRWEDLDIWVTPPPQKESFAQQVLREYGGPPR